ncbi:hypothetical protein BTE77_06895 [Ensifer adhaerens]|nr:hypothetical protein BTE77_06895 [Ensifer adhaerens]
MRQQLDALFEGNETELARQIGPDQQQNVNNFITGKVKRSSLWREIAALLQISEDEMRNLMRLRKMQDGKNTKLPTPFKMADYFPDMSAKTVATHTGNERMLPVLGRAVGGDAGEYEFNGQPIEWVPCPPPLMNVADAYAIFADGFSMSPRYRPGSVLLVHPSKPPRRDDGVVVQLKPTEDGVAPRGFIKSFIGWSPSKLILEQYTPAKKVEFDRDHVLAVHLIVMSGEYY